MARFPINDSRCSIRRNCLYAILPILFIMYLLYIQLYLYYPSVNSFSLGFQLTTRDEFLMYDVRLIYSIRWNYLYAILPILFIIRPIVFITLVILSIHFYSIHEFFGYRVTMLHVNPFSLDFQLTTREFSGYGK